MNIITSFFFGKPKQLPSDSATSLPQPAKSSTLPPPRSTRSVLALSRLSSPSECDTTKGYRLQERRHASASKSPARPAYPQAPYSGYVANIRLKIGGNEQANPLPVHTQSSAHTNDSPAELPATSNSSLTRLPQLVPTGQPKAIPVIWPALPLGGLEGEHQNGGIPPRSQGLKRRPVPLGNSPFIGPVGYYGRCGEPRELIKTVDLTYYELGILVWAIRRA